MINRGVEITLNGSILRTEDFSWDIGVMFAHNKNEVTYVNVEAPVYFLQLDYPSEFPRVGTNYNSIYAYKWAGLSSTGLPQVYDAEQTLYPTIREILKPLRIMAPRFQSRVDPSIPP